MTPKVSWWPGMQPDQFALYERTLERLQELAPTLVYPDHRSLISDVAARAAAIRARHRHGSTKSSATCAMEREAPTTSSSAAGASS